MSTDRIEKSVALNAPIERVWRALTDYKEFGAWFRVTLDGPFAVGEVSTGQIDFEACGHQDLKWSAEVKKMDKPHFFSFTWHPYAVETGVDYSKEPPTLVEFHLKATATGTQLTVIESGFDALPKERRDTALRMNDGGWAAQLQNIQTHVEA